MFDGGSKMIKNIKKEAESVMDEIIEEFSDKPSSEETELISHLRQVAPKMYFIPFLENFIEHVEDSGKKINSQYLIRILLNNHKCLFEKDFLGESGTSYNYSKEKIFIIDKKKDLFIEKGVIFNIINDLELEETINYISEVVLKKYSNGSPDSEVIDLFEIVNKKEVLEKVKKEFDEKLINSKLISN